VDIIDLDKEKKKKKKKPLNLEELDNAIADMDATNEMGIDDESKGGEDDFDFGMDMDFSKKKKKKKKKDLDDLVAEEEAEKPDEKDSGKISLDNFFTCGRPLLH